MTVTLIIQGKDYAILRAEADRRNVAVSALVRAIVSYAVEGNVDLDKVGDLRSSKPRRVTRDKVLWNGKLVSLLQIAREVGINYNTLHHRLAAGLRLEDAVRSKKLRHGEMKLLSAKANGDA